MNLENAKWLQIKIFFLVILTFFVLEDVGMFLDDDNASVAIALSVI